MVLTTHEARVVHAVLEFGPGTVGLMSESDRALLARAKAKLGAHVQALLQSMQGAGQLGSRGEPA